MTYVLIRKHLFIRDSIGRRSPPEAHGAEGVPIGELHLHFHHYLGQRRGGWRGSGPPPHRAFDAWNSTSETRRMAREVRRG